METPWNSFRAVRTDCRFFRGHIPCSPHKQSGVHCTEADGAPCPHYDPVEGNILLIKLGAAGDVIRTTPLVRRLRELHPRARFWWLTSFPDVLTGVVDVVLPFSPESLSVLHAIEFQLLVNLDKDREACALAATVPARSRRGFSLQNGVPVPIDEAAEPKYLTGLFDDLSKANTRSYVEEIFEICGLSFAGERYILDPCDADRLPWKLPKGKAVVGLNTGSGGRWVSRQWPTRHWAALARNLKRAGYVPLLLGGPQEHLQNQRLARATGAKYFGFFPIRRFINLTSRCDIVVTAVTMAMHITIGLGKKVVVLNNIFNRHEFELYGLGEVIEPPTGCTCFYSPRCTNPEFAPDGCMRTLRPDDVFHVVRRTLVS
jgi:heptosyltransferase-2